MKKFLPLLFLVVLWSCEFPDIRPKAPSHVFTEFEDLRLNIYLDSSLNPSYHNTEEWKIYLEGIEETLSIRLDIAKSDVSENFDYLIFATLPGTWLDGTYKGIIDFGNGDIDSLGIIYSRYYRLSYDDDLWVDKIWAEGDTLTRGDNLHFEYFKED